MENQREYKVDNLTEDPDRIKTAQEDKITLKKMT